MTDIVERLRSTHGDTWPRQIGFGDLNNEDGPEAADDIERLRAALQAWARSNEAMEWIDDDSPLVRQTIEALGDN